MYHSRTFFRNGICKKEELDCLTALLGDQRMCSSEESDLVASDAELITPIIITRLIGDM